MSTNSTIRIERKDGTKTGIYCHYDGYIEGVGVTLQLAYNTSEKVETLLKLGDLSSLSYYTESHNGTNDFVCSAYYRDWHEDYKQTNNNDNEFVYIFNEQEQTWYVEIEKCVQKTAGQKALLLDTYYTKEKKLLLDEIMEKDFKNWVDDEFATSDNVIENCINKAKEARKEIIEKEIERYNAYYEAYCI